MNSLTGLEYDACREWIKRKHDKGASWDELRYACKADENRLTNFIQNRIDEDDWPAELDNEKWYALVESQEQDEQRKIKLQRSHRMAVLHDGSDENNGVTIPMDERSAWQMYRDYLKENKHFSEDSIQKIEEASHGILKRLNINMVDNSPIKGLVIGNVQSGKTANMAALMAMAADWGYNMFIVLSGTIENLRRQTQSRLYKDLNQPGNLSWVQFDHLSKRSPSGWRLCDLHLNDDRTRYMTVCLKVKSRLEQLLDWLSTDSQNIKNLRILVIDDEADQASINTGDVYTDSERRTINRLILNLVHCQVKKTKGKYHEVSGSHYKAMNYISYTATPYANCLNETGPYTLYPANFIRTLDVSQSYFGPDRYFGTADADDDRRLDVVRTIPNSDVSIIKNLQKYDSGEIPESLKDAICWFFCSVACMRYYSYKKPVSMLIHTSQKQKDHSTLAGAVQRWLNSGQEQIGARCRLIYETETKTLTKEEFRIHYPDYEHPDEEIWDYPNYEDIAIYIKELTSEISSIMMDDDGDLRYCRGVHLCIDNCANNGVTEEGMHMRLAYPDENDPNKPDYATAFIVIGGNTLSRGLTLEGLVSTFFLRSVKQMDTLMQMGRWFGYRVHYELFPRIWLTTDTERKFELLADVDKDLREQIYQMQLAGKGPEDFSLAIMTSPKVSWMRLTASNRMQMAGPAEVDFSGMDMQLTVYSKDESAQKNNLSVTRDFLHDLGDSYRKSANTEAYIWDDVAFETIASGFFEKGFLIPDTSRSFQQIEPMKEWIEEQTKKGEMTKWNVILCGLKITDKMTNDRIWRPVDGIKIGKINRSCKTDSDDHINIGVLSGKKDYVADITQAMLGPVEWREMISCKTISNDYITYRKRAHVDKIPLFLIYIIDRNSKASSAKRKSLEMAEDLVGITMVIPGIRGAHGAVTRLKIMKIINTEEDEQ